MSDRVRIGHCHGPADAALVRAMLDAHGIVSVVGGEQHASMLGGLGGAFISLDIWVSADDAEQAAALLGELRAAQAAGADADADADADEPGADGELGAAADDGQEQGDRAVAAEGGDDPQAAMVEARVERRRRTGLALLIGVVAPFGTAHMSTRAWKRGITLAAVQVVALGWVFGAHPIAGMALFFAAIAADLTGAVWRIRAATPLPPPPAPLPPARALTR